MAIHLLEHAVLRAAAWPIETADAFAAPGVAATARALLAAERRVLARRERVAAALHAAVPRAADRASRAYLLALKRHVHAGSTPFPAPPAGAMLALAPELA